MQVDFLPNLRLLSECPDDSRAVETVYVIAVQIFKSKELAADLAEVYSILDRLPLKRRQIKKLYCALVGARYSSVQVTELQKKKIQFKNFSETFTLSFQDESLVVTKPELLTYGKYFESLLSSSMEETATHEIKFSDDSSQDFKLMIQLMKGDAFDLNRPYIWHRIRSVADRFMNAKIIEVLPSSPPYDNFREMIAYVSKYRQNVLDVSQYRWKITHRRLETLRDLGCLDVLVIDGIKIPLRLNPDGISSKKLTVIDEYHWNQYVDLKKYGISFEGVPPIKEVASRISQNIGHQNCTIIRIPNGLTLDSCIQIALPFFKFKSQVCSRSLVPSGVFIFPNQNTNIKDPSISPSIAHCVLYSYFSFLLGKKINFKSIVDETKSKVYYGMDGKAFSTVTKYQFQSDSNKLRMSVTVAN